MPKNEYKQKSECRVLLAFVSLSTLSTSWSLLPNRPLPLE
ncbi:hypothetical protein B4119_1350 [Parageobacillus caldoxylosilyticus]|uniref:Uncharacterized protein n=1 Tax=Saccharococcus caldoxylosilyticus TaxID=81408 RepID=A0A150L584_9BACL|nr:hypothetical protein B4119_1350 [Parageobacillus caldoxylosilyticus]